MKKLYFLLFTLLTVSFSFAQGTETFDNFTATGSSYTDGTFTGNDGSTWTYVQSRGDQSITGKSIMLGKDRTPQAEVYSGTISGGVGTINFNYEQAFSTNVNLNVLVNGIVVGNVTSSSEAGVPKASGTITVNQPGDVVIKFSNPSGGGQVTIDDIIWTGYTGAATPTLAVTSPSDNATYSSGTTSVDIEFTTANTNAGDQVNITVNSGTPSTAVTSPFTINTVDGQTYTVLVELVDSGSAVLDSETINFEVLFPCTLQIGTITTTCVTETAGVDLYDVSIPYTGGATSQYTIDTESNGTVEGDDPTNIAAGTISITGVSEGTDFTVTFTGNPTDSSCDISRSVNSPVCVGATCANPGDIIITEIMQNPLAVGDSEGEYFEVYNTTGSPIDMAGWEMVDLTSTSEGFTIASSVVVPANGYAIFGVNADFATNGGVNVDYEYDGSSTYLGNGADEISLQCSSTVIDEVLWDGGPNFPDPNGASMELSTLHLNSTDNDTGANWGTATTEISTGGDLGTPGAANDFTLSIAQFETNSFNIYPNPTSTGFVNITSSSNELLKAKVFDILGKQIIESTVSNNQLNVSGLNAGVYILKLTQNNASVTKKLVIK